MKKILSLLAILLALTACKTYSEKDIAGFDSKIQKYVAKSGIPYKRSESRLYYYIEKEGEGEYIKYTDEVSFVYEGKLLNGDLFDASHKRKPFTMEVSKLIEGWKEAFAYLKNGGKAKLIIPPTLGYGDHDLKDIPPHSILLFDLEITDVK